MPVYNVSDIANYFLLKADDSDQELLSNMKLQKLMYYAQGMHLVFFNEPLFEDTIKAWAYGPVIPALYHEYKSYEKGGIPPKDEFDPSIIDDETREFLDEIYGAFGQFSAIRLMELSHCDQCWIDAFASDDKVITKEAMKNELRKYQADEQG